ncbi:MAG TPA: sulfotransferase [Gaiellaceae bacterium]|nr:sulfotransferase [Gaiellaceae bacterium]
MSNEIFVVGASRSGTNLVRALLNAHSTLWVSGETHYFDDLRPQLPGDGAEQLAGADRERCEGYFLALSHRAFGQAGDPDESWLERDELRALAAELGGTGDAYFEALCRLRAERHGRERWGEKTPRHVYRIDELLSAFPEAKVVCLVRDPRAVVASYKDWHGAAERRGVTESPELEADRERSRRSYNPVLMSLLWRGVVRASFEALERHGPERVRIQRFERLAATPEAEVRELCDWLGLEYEPALLEIPVVNSSYATRGAGVSSEPVERWRERLSPGEVGIVQSVCEPLLSELDYTPDHVTVSPVRLALAWATVPFAAARAAVVNRQRLGKATQYLRTRARTAFSRGPL